jgi:hypothetical protein
MNRDELLRALALLTALEYPSVAREAAAVLPEWMDIVDLLRAGDGVQQLARAFDELRRGQAA